MPTNPSDPQGDNSREAHALEEERKAQHCDTGVLLLGGSCGVEDDHKGEVSEENISFIMSFKWLFSLLKMYLGRKEKDGEGSVLPWLEELHEERTAETTEGETSLGDGKVNGAGGGGCSSADFDCVVDEVSCYCHCP